MMNPPTPPSRPQAPPFHVTRLLAIALGLLLAGCVPSIFHTAGGTVVSTEYGNFTILAAEATDTLCANTDEGMVNCQLATGNESFLTIWLAPTSQGDSGDSATLQEKALGASISLKPPTGQAVPLEATSRRLSKNPPTPGKATLEDTVGLVFRVDKDVRTFDLIVGNRAPVRVDRNALPTKH